MFITHSAKSYCKNVSNVEKTETPLWFIAFVAHGDDVNDTWDKPILEEPEENSYKDKTIVNSYDALSSSRYTCQRR